MVPRIIFTSLIYFLTLSMSASQLSALLPKQTAGYAANDTDNYYNTETLYNYIDGAAELYLSYGFDTVISRRFVCPNEPDIVVEIFNMNEPRDAFGVFTNMREKNQNQYGQGSQQIQGSLIFWKNRYFVSLIAEQSTPSALNAMNEIAKYIDNSIEDDARIPEIIETLPAANLVPEGYCYFHHYIWLNAFYFIANNNILNIDNSTDAVLAKYEISGKRMYLLVVQYPGENEAKEGYNKFINEYAPELKTKEAVKMEDKTWHTAKVVGSCFVGVFNAPNKDEALKLSNIRPLRPPVQ
jgi:hypothetical protein